MKRTTREKLEKFFSRADVDEVADILELYITETIPGYSNGAGNAWNVSLLPSTNKGSWPRLACISMYKMETFAIGYIREEPETLWAFVNVNPQALHKTYPTDASLLEEFPNVQIETMGYGAAPGCINLFMYPADDIISVLSDETVINAARSLNAYLIGQGDSVYRRYHSKELTSWVLTGELPDENAEDEAPDPDAVRLGSRVTVREGSSPEEIYTLVDVTEVNPLKGKISIESPIGSALEGCKAGDTVIAETPTGDIELQVIKVENN